MAGRADCPGPAAAQGVPAPPLSRWDRAGDGCQQQGRVRDGLKEVNGGACLCENTFLESSQPLDEKDVRDIQSYTKGEGI